MATRTAGAVPLQSGGVTAPDPTAYDRKFDELFANGGRHVLAGTHHRDGPLVDGGRWGISILLRPDAATAATLEQVAVAARSLAGSGHWLTGSATTSHVTVLPLEPYRHAVPDGDPHVARYGDGLRTAAACSRPVRLRFRGLTMTPHGVMACAYPVDDAADALAENLTSSIGRNRFSDRDIWYATVLHFAGPIDRPQALVDWVAARRTVDLGQTHCDEAHLVRCRSNGGLPVPVTLASAALSAPARAVSDRR